MKNWFHKFIYAVVVLTTLNSCEKDEIKAVINSGAVPVVTLSASSVVLTKENADKDALTISWAKPDYGFNAPAAYTILIDKKGGDFSNATAITTGAELKKTFKTSELNPILLKLGLKVATAGDVDVKVQSFLGGSTNLNSSVVSLKATPYLDKLDLSTNLGVVGSAANNWGATPDLPFYKTDKSNVYVAYVTLTDGEIKFRENNKWDVNYGGTNGTLVKGGDNIVVKAGSYKITVDFEALKYTVEKFSWGIVGSATPNGWSAPDVPFFYDPSSDQWRSIATLKDGEIKVRQNEDWTVNYGDKGADGTLEVGGDNIVVKAGTYLVTVDFKTLKYTIVPTKVWGVVGSATPNGWNGPDAKFRPDFGTEGIFTLSNIKLIDGEIKFRQNDDWAVNYGDDKADGVIEAGGANIAVKAGTYDIVLDFTNAAKPTYKFIKR
ncbi:SusF/SusE family outer membrane protein [Runella sp. CRIBMP]|uniref:SusE domain-containing protein n=1 Tax=Runella sp. CRIBMP TaxID=2683261 RepID=UPI001412621C|nr:SusE domain-containing protein [Runella sp. CRIBMP]NBB20739.1 SusF/SusE family outer membrane protein [Runella sp. CRIBMP]